jgi:hypothetical protein
MRSTKIQGYKANRNNLRYLITNPFVEPPAYTFLKLLEKEKVFIINKNEQIDSEFNNISYKIKKGKEIIDIFVSISKDHLIKMRLVTQYETKLITTRVLNEALLLVKECLC